MIAIIRVISSCRALRRTTTWPAGLASESVWPNYNTPPDSKAEHNSDWKKPLHPLSVRGSGNAMGVRQTVPVVVGKSGVTTGADPFAVGPFFGRDAGD